jgi:tetratricopeptide (TPR) repeat protein
MKMRATEPEALHALQRKVCFNTILAEFISSYLRPLWLDESLVKYADDTWMLVSGSRNDVSGFCCLAKLLSEKFKDELAAATGILTEKVPDIEISVSGSHGRRIDLPGGRREWVGEKSSFIAHHWNLVGVDDKVVKVLIDEAVRDVVAGKFEIETLGQPAGLESEGNGNDAGDETVDYNATVGADEPVAGSASAGRNAPAYVLGAVSGDATGSNTDDAERYVYLKSLIGAMQPAEMFDTALLLIKSYKSHDVDGAKDTLSTIGRRFGTLMSACGEYEIALKLLDEMKELAIMPDADIIADTFVPLIKLAPDYNEALALTERLKEEKTDYDSYDSAILTALTAKASDYVTARSWLDTAHKFGTIPGVEAYNRCINKAPDVVQANAVYDEMLLFDVLPNVDTYNALVAKSTDVEQAKLLLTKMLEEDLLPNLFIYNRVIAKCGDYDTALAIFEEVLSMDIKPNAITFNTLVSRAPEYNVALSWIDKMNSGGVSPNVDTFVRLFSKDIGAIRAKDLLDTYRRWNLPSDEPLQTAISTYQKNGRIDQALYLAVDYPHLPAARKLIREIMSEVSKYLEGVEGDESKISLESYNSLIEDAPFYDTAMSWLDTMKTNGVEPDGAIYTALIKKAPDFETGRAWIDQMIEAGIEPSIDAFDMLFSKSLADVEPGALIEWFKESLCPSDDPIGTAIRTYKRLGLSSQALKAALEYPHLNDAKLVIKEHVSKVFNYLKTVCRESQLFDVDAYTELIVKAPYYDIAETWLDVMKAKSVMPSVATYNALIAKAPDYETVTKLLNALMVDKLQPNLVTYGTMISKSPSYETAKHWFRAMYEDGMKHNVVTYSALISKAPDFMVARSLLDEMKSIGIKPNVISYNAAINIVVEFDVAKGIVEEMFLSKVQPNAVTFNRLFSKNISEVRAPELLRWYGRLKYHPEDPMQAAISNYRKLGLIEDAVFIAQRYPKLAISKKIMAEHRRNGGAAGVRGVGGFAVGGSISGSTNTNNPDASKVSGFAGDSKNARQEKHKADDGKAINRSEMWGSADSGAAKTVETRRYIDEAKKSAGLQHCLRIMDGELSSGVNL